MAKTKKPMKEQLKDLEYKLTQTWISFYFMNEGLMHGSLYSGNEPLARSRLHFITTQLQSLEFDLKGYMDTWGK